MVQKPEQGTLFGVIQNTTELKETVTLISIVSTPSYPAFGMEWMSFMKLMSGVY